MYEITISPKRFLKSYEFKKYLKLVRLIATFDNNAKCWKISEYNLKKNIHNYEELVKILAELEQYANITPSKELILQLYKKIKSDVEIRNNLTIVIKKIVSKEVFDELLKYLRYLGHRTFILRSTFYLDDLIKFLKDKGFEVYIDPEVNAKLKEFRSCKIYRDKGDLVIKLNYPDELVINKLKETCNVRYFIERVILDENGNFVDTVREERKLRLFKYITESNEIRTSVGLIDRIEKVLQDLGVRYTIEIEPMNDIPYQIRPNFELLPHQKVAYELWRKKKRGTIAIFTRGGKSFIALKAIAELKKPTLILVTTKELATTWKSYLTKYLSINESLIGYLGEGKKLIKPITIAIYNSCVRYIDSIRDKFELLVCDECLIPDTWINTEYGIMTIDSIVDKYFTEKETGYKVIAPIRVTDGLSWTEVIGVLRRKATEMIKITLETGFDFIVTPTHPMVVYRGDKIKILEAQELNIYDKLLIPRIQPFPAKIKAESYLYWLLGLAIGYGIINGNDVYFKLKKIDYMAIRILEALRETNLDYKLIKSNLHLEVVLKDFLSHVRGITREWGNIFATTKKNIRAFIRGIFDSCGELNGNVVTIKHYDKTMLNIIARLLEYCGILPTKVDDHKILIKGLHLETFTKKIGSTSLEIQEKLKELCRLERNTTNKEARIEKKYFIIPIRKISTMNYEGFVYDFTTISGTFNANNILTHNCHHVPANTFKEVVIKMSSLYRMALSATPKRRDGNEELLYALCGPLLINLDYKDLVEMRIVAPIEIFETKYVMGEKEKIKELKNILYKHFNEKAIVFTQYVNTANKLYMELLREGFKVALITGSTSQAKRKRAFQEFLKGNIKVIVATTVLDEGITVPDAEVAIIYEGTGEARQMIQRIGRVLGYMPGKTAKIYELVDITNPKEKRAHFRRKWVKELYLFPELKKYVLSEKTGIPAKYKSKFVYQMRLDFD